STLDKSPSFDSNESDSERCGTSVRIDGDSEGEAGMGRAGAGLAAARPDSIKGLAQSIAKPAYRRLLIAEPALRRAVPCLIIAFMITVGVGALVQVRDRYRQAIINANADIEVLAEVIAQDLNRSAVGLADRDSAQTALEDAIPARARLPGRHVVLLD